MADARASVPKRGPILSPLEVLEGGEAELVSVLVGIGRGGSGSNLTPPMAARPLRISGFVLRIGRAHVLPGGSWLRR